MEVPDSRIFFTAIQHPDHCINYISHDVNACSADPRRKQQLSALYKQIIHP